MNTKDICNLIKIYRFFSYEIFIQIMYNTFSKLSNLCINLYFWLEPVKILQYNSLNIRNCLNFIDISQNVGCLLKFLFEK